MSGDTRSADLLVQSVLSDDSKVAALKTDPGPVLRAAATEAINQSRALDTDPWVYRLVVGLLGTTALTVVFGCIAYSLMKASGDLPSGLVALGSAAVGALAGLLAPAPNRG